METPLPSNEALVAFSEALPWQEIEQQKERFYHEIRRLALEGVSGTRSPSIISQKLSGHNCQKLTLRPADEGGCSANLFGGKPTASAVRPRQCCQRALSSAVNPCWTASLPMT